MNGTTPVHVVRVRLSGPPEAVAVLARNVRAAVHVAEGSADYPNRRAGGVRRYLSVVVVPDGVQAPRIEEARS